MANVLGSRIGGNLVYTDVSAARIVQAVGPDVIQYFDDFVGVHVAAHAVPGWVTTLVGASTVTVPPVVGGALLLTTAAAENDGVTLQMAGRAYQLGAGRTLYFGTRLRISDAIESDLFVGLAVTDTTPLGGVTDGIFFQKDDGAATFKTTTEKDSVETNTAVAGSLVTGTDVTLEFYATGLSVTFYLNGVRVAKHTTNVPDDEVLTPTIQFITGAAAAKTLQLDWLRVVQFGR